VASILKSLRGLADPTRLRILRLLREEDLSVAELQEILSMGQSRISTQLAQLRESGLVVDRRSGKKVIYALATDINGGLDLQQLLDSVEAEIEEARTDLAALELVRKNRDDRMRAYFDELAGKFGKKYVPGRSWKALAETLLKLLPPMKIADLGSGEGTFSQLLAQQAEQVIGVDNSEKMIEVSSGLAKDHGFTNLEFRHGDLENPPIDDEAMDLVFLSQALHHASRPERAVDSAFRILRPGGRIVILDLLKHGFEEARDLYHDTWLGFAEVELHEFLKKSGFSAIETTIVSKEKVPPHFQTVLALAIKPTSDA
jgi:ubiquinone/menaquinone biosynthesis C-methylase UbiE/DNA-binding transcriptional ArsR family regulator